MANTVVGFAKPALPPTLTKAGVAAATQSQPLPSSTTQPGRAQADSSKKEKVSGRAAGTTAPCSASIQPVLSLPQKQQIQEKAISEVKTAIKPFYQRKEITKEEYKEIVRKAVEKVKSANAGVSPSALGEIPFLNAIFGRIRSSLGSELEKRTFSTYG